MPPAAIINYVFLHTTLLCKNEKCAWGQKCYIPTEQGWGEVEGVAKQNGSRNSLTSSSYLQGAAETSEKLKKMYADVYLFLFMIKNQACSSLKLLPLSERVSVVLKTKQREIRPVSLFTRDVCCQCFLCSSCE